MDLFKDLLAKDDNLETLEERIFKSSYTDVEKRKLYSEFLKFKQEKENTGSQSIIQSIIKHEDFIEDGNYIVHTRFIPCQVIKYRTSVEILNESQISSLIECGFGIEEFKVKKDNPIDTIICKGKHPNMSVNSGSFCNKLLPSMDLSFNNLMYIRNMMVQCDLRSAYYKSSDVQTLIDIVSDS